MNGIHMSRSGVHCLLACVALAAAPLDALAQARPAAERPAAAVMPQPEPAERMFKAIDADGDGQLSLAEFRNGWMRLQRSEAQVRMRQQFASVDTDHSGAIEAGEYANLRLVRSAGAKAPPLARFDADGDGKLQFGEYVALVQGLASAGAGQGSGK